MREGNDSRTPAVTTVNEKVPPTAKPPKYSDLFDQNSASSSAKSSPPRYSSKTPSVDISSSNEKLDAAKKVEEPPKKVKIIKPKKVKKPTENTKTEEKSNTEDTVKM